MGSLKVLDYILSFLDSQCAHMYRPDSLGFLDYTARLAGLYMPSCDSVSQQIPRGGSPPFGTEPTRNAEVYHALSARSYFDAVHISI